MFFGTNAITVGDEIMCARTCSKDIIRYELVHVGQENRDGLFLPRYLWQAATRGHCQIDYEIEAYEAGGTCG